MEKYFWARCLDFSLIEYLEKSCIYLSILYLSKYKTFPILLIFIIINLGVFMNMGKINKNNISREYGRIKRFLNLKRLDLGLVIVLTVMNILVYLY